MEPLSSVGRHVLRFKIPGDRYVRSLVFATPDGRSKFLRSLYDRHGSGVAAFFPEGAS